jgi:hypothetical protein
MDRLTGWDHGNAFFKACFENGGCKHMGTDKCADCVHMLRACNKLAAYEDAGMEPEQIMEAANRKHNCKIECLLKKYIANLEELKHFRDLTKMVSIAHIRELLEAEKDGRLVVLPCKVGDTAYLIDYIEEKARRCEIDGFASYGETTLAMLSSDEAFSSTNGCGIVNINDFGKLIFLTREEAEQASKESN